MHCTKDCCHDFMYGRTPALIAAFVAFVFLVLALAVPDWFSTKQVNFGLYKLQIIDVTYDIDWGCKYKSIPLLKDSLCTKFLAVRAMVLVSAILSGMAFLFLTANVCGKMQAVLWKVAVYFTVTSLGTGIAATVVASQINTTDVHLESCFYIHIISWSCCLLMLLLLFMENKWELRGETHHDQYGKVAPSAEDGGPVSYSITPPSVVSAWGLYTPVRQSNWTRSREPDKISSLSRRSTTTTMKTPSTAQTSPPPSAAAEASGVGSAVTTDKPVATDKAVTSDNAVMPTSPIP